MRRKPEISTAKVWKGGHRRYFSKKAAATAEGRELAKRILARKHGRFWDQHSQEEFEELMKKCVLKILNLWDKNAPSA